MGQIRKMSFLDSLSTKEQSATFTDSNTSIYLTEARVYIAGVLMPTINVEITSTFDTPPRASVSLPAYSDLLYLGDYDRVPVHIFVRETMVESPNFVLMFEGFIESTLYINSAIQRTVTVQAVSYLDFLNDVQVKFMTTLDEYFQPVLKGEMDLKVFISSNEITFPMYLFRYGLVKGGHREGTKPIQFPSDYLENIYAFIQTSKPYKTGDNLENSESSSSTSSTQGESEEADGYQ